MLQWFIRFPEFAEFSEFLFHLGKTPLHSIKNFIHVLLHFSGYPILDVIVIIVYFYQDSFLFHKVNYGYKSALKPNHDYYDIINAIISLFVRFKWSIIVEIRKFLCHQWGFFYCQPKYADTTSTKYYLNFHHYNCYLAFCASQKGTPLSEHGRFKDWTDNSATVARSVPDFNFDISRACPWNNYYC